MKALILTSHIEKFDQIKLDYSGFDSIICADGGYIYAEKASLSPDTYIGDYDSADRPFDKDCIVLPCEKDVTDSEAAIDLAVAKGFDPIVVLGGLGGRFDHTMGNVGLLSKHLSGVSHLAFVDGQNYIFMLKPGEYEIPKNQYKYLGLISYGPYVKGLSISGTKYVLCEHDLDDSTTLGVSNEITSDMAKLSFESGKLLVILSNET